MSGAVNLEIYPRCCFSLSPTFDNWCILRSADIHRLSQHPGFEGQNFYFYNNLPMRWVRVVGVVVAIDEFYGRRVFTIDDSSDACIEAITTYTPPPKTEPPTTGQVRATNGRSIDAKSSEAKHIPTAKKKSSEPSAPLSYEDLDVGHVVDVKGRLTAFRDEMQIEIVKLTTLRSTDQEIALWERRTQFRREVLDKPWTLTERQIRHCRKETDTEEDKAARRKRRLKAAAERVSSLTRDKQKIHSKQKHKSLKGVIGDGQEDIAAG